MGGPYSAEEIREAAKLVVWRDAAKNGTTPGDDNNMSAAAGEIMVHGFGPDPSTWMLWEKNEEGKATPPTQPVQLLVDARTPNLSCIFF